MTEPDDSVAPPFRLSDLRQQRVHERLGKLLGPGPASLFIDACRLMGESAKFDSTTHLVGHLLREIESAIRDALSPIVRPARATGAQGPEVSAPGDRQSAHARSRGASGGRCDPDAGDPNESHSEQVRAILKSLLLSEDEAVARAWLRLATTDENLPRYAHRRHFDAPRPIGPDFLRLWEDTVSILDVVLARFEAQYAGVFREIARLRSLESPTADDVKLLLSRLPNSFTAREAFFGGLDNPRWIAPLRRKGFFRSPPAPYASADGKSTVYVVWPEARYLARMAQLSSAQPEVATALAGMEQTENFRVIADVLDALSCLPVAQSRPTIERVVAWAESQSRIGAVIPEKLAALTLHLKASGELTLARRALRSILAIRLPAYGEYGGPSARISSWDYRRLTAAEGPFLGAIAGAQEKCDLLLSLLEDPLPAPNGAVSQDAGVSTLWRPAIEESDQNDDNPFDVLVAAVRDALQAAVDQDPAALPRLLERLEKPGPLKGLRHRLWLHLLRTSKGSDLERIAAILRDPAHFSEVEVHHETALLLRDRFDDLAPAVQEEVCRLLQAAPWVDAALKRRTTEGNPLDAAEEERYRAVVARDWLTLIAPHLSGASRTLYDDLVARFGEAEHPEFLSFMSGTFGAVGHESPKAAEALADLPPSELRAFLDTWVPEADPFHGPNREGLGEELCAAVAGDVDHFAAGLADLETEEPTYARAVVRGFIQAVASGQPIPWSPVLSYCKWILRQGLAEPEALGHVWGRDPGWTWAWGAVSDLVEAGLKEGAARVPVGERRQIWAVLDALLQTPAPQVEGRQEPFDLVEIAINNTRGRAFERMLDYAFWVREQTGADPEGGFSQMPEVRDVLDRHLDPSIEPSLAMRALYGLHLPRLFALDRRWLEGTKGQIFPKDPGRRAERDAAWSAYLRYCRLYNDVFALVEDVYRAGVEAVAELAESNRDLAFKLGEHLVFLYWRGKLRLGSPDGLLDRYFALGLPSARAHVIDLVGRAIWKNDAPVSPEVQERLRSLWDSRLAAAKVDPPSAREELAAFSWWFASSVLDPAWAAERLLAGAALRGGLPADHWLLESLNDRVETIPRETLEILRAMAIGESDAMQFAVEASGVRDVFRVAREKLGEAGASVIEEIASLVAAKGYPGLVDLTEARNDEEDFAAPISG